MRSRVWDTFLPIPATRSEIASDEPPALDSEWLAARGMCKSAPAVLKLLCEDVTPLVMRFGKKLDWYSFLVHDRSSGVPAVEGDDRAFVHLRLVFRRPAQLSQPDMSPWQMTKPMPEASDVVGEACRLIGYQSECLLRIVRQCRVKDEARWVRLVKQHLHYFANMTQMRVT